MKPFGAEKKKYDGDRSAGPMKPYGHPLRIEHLMQMIHYHEHSAGQFQLISAQAIHPIYPPLMFVHLLILAKSKAAMRETRRQSLRIRKMTLK
jgi:hypothetical protein